MSEFENEDAGFENNANNEEENEDLENIGENNSNKIEELEHIDEIEDFRQTYDRMVKESQRRTIPF